MNRKNTLRTYLAATAGVGCAAVVAEGAVTFYGINSANDTNADPNGVSIGQSPSSTFRLNPQDPGNPDAISASFFNYTTDFQYFTTGADLGTSDFGSRTGLYFRSGTFRYGATAGAANYINVSFDGDDNVYEAVAQFFLDGAGGGYLIAIATTNPVPNPQDLSGVGGPGLSISAGKMMIDNAIPEPSSLALLALGSVGLTARRKRKQVA